MNNQRLIKRKLIPLLIAFTIFGSAARNIYRVKGFFDGGSRISNQHPDFVQGTVEYTGRNTDVAIDGSGFFRVKLPNAVGGAAVYTRNGIFYVSSQGHLVVGMGDVYEMDPPIAIPAGISNLQISLDGIITGTKSGAGVPTQVGRIQLTQFVNPRALHLSASGLYQETQASGPPSNGNPGECGAGTLLPRSIELDGQSILAADKPQQTITNLRRS